jgi:hypothetical protein
MTMVKARLDKVFVLRDKHFNAWLECNGVT